MKGIKNMEINKQLFEDVLSGKLKGTFVLRNKQKISSNKLIRSNSYYSETHPYRLISTTYTPKGFSSLLYNKWKTCDDIIDFIPETDMKENELTIEIPDNKIVDWEESKKQNKIVLKDKQLTYEDICEKLFKDKDIFYTKADGCIGNAPYHEIKNCIYDANNATSKHQLECILAKNKLANVAKYLNDGWKPGKGSCVFTITCYGDFNNAPIISEYYFGNGENLMPFRTFNGAKQAIEILGEETIKLALEPLGI